MPLPRQVDRVLDQITGMSCDDQYEIARRVASNIGYQLLPEGNTIQDAEDKAAVRARLDRLEGAVKDLNPGWDP